MALACIVLTAAFTPWLLPESPATEADLALADEVERLEAAPIDLNRATAEQLLRVPWLEPFLAHRIVVFRDSAGGFRDVRQLAQVPSMTADVLESLLPFVTVVPRRRLLRGGLTTRVRTDSLGGGAKRCVSFGRAAGDLGAWSGVFVMEKDAGEARLDDYLGAGVQLAAPRARVVFVDYGFGSGQGLVFSRPEWRSSYLDGRGSSTSGPAALHTAAEGSRLRGAAAQLVASGWRLAVLGSYAGRDAELNGDGTVARLLNGGVHDDSGSEAARNSVREATGGAAMEFRRGVSAFGLTTGFSGYSRSFAPPESSGSFFGRALAYGGAGAAVVLGDYRVGLELAGASSGGAAAPP
jgi:hypothetical protein